MSVYVLSAVGANMIKVGYSKDPLRRWRELRASCGPQLKVALCLDHAERRIETETHRALRGLKSHNEWYPEQSALPVVRKLFQSLEEQAIRRADELLKKIDVRNEFLSLTRHHRSLGNEYFAWILASRCQTLVAREEI
jgi:T5orf172 domain